MRIAAVSDLHGHLSHSIPECDVLCIAGDIPPLLSTAENWKSAQELHWLETKFLRWLKRQPFDECLIGWGNHDIFAMDPMTRRDAIIMLQNSMPGVTVLDVDNPTTVIDGVRFSAYPYTPTIQQRNWAYSLPRGDHRVELGLDYCVHPQTDVLISHGPPLGFLDLVPDRKENTGCAMLAKKIIEVAPSHVICGHIHEARGQRAWMWNSKGFQTRIINASICDRNYSPKGANVQQFTTGE